MRTTHLFFGAALSLFVLAAAASCSPTPPDGTGGGPDCSTEPFTCDAGQTCWPNEQVTKFKCLDALAGKKSGDACKFIGGEVACGENQVCIVQGGTEGTCTDYCSDGGGSGGASSTSTSGAGGARPCADGSKCTQFSIDGGSGTKFVVHACAVDDATSTTSGTTTSGTTTSGTTSATGG